MNGAFRYFWRHPRRTGFLVFNAIAVVLFIAWGASTERMAHNGISALPNVMLGYTGMLLLVVALVAGWTAWAIMVARRHARATERARNAQG